MIDYTKEENCPNWAKIQKIIKHDDNNIIGMFLQYRYLSNFHICHIEYEGLKFTSTEAAYHSAKFNSTKLKQLLSTMGPMESLRESRKHKIDIPNWHSTFKFEVMYDVNWIKFNIPELKNMLLDTENKHIVEKNWWRDIVWGQDADGNGENNLGKIIMKIRDNLKYNLDNILV